MTEQKNELNPTVSLLIEEALQTFATNDAYDDEKGQHANTLLRSSKKAILKISEITKISALDIYQLATPDGQSIIQTLRLQQMTDDDIERLAMQKLAQVVKGELLTIYPRLSEEENERMQRFGIVR